MPISYRVTTSPLEELENVTVMWHIRPHLSTYLKNPLNILDATFSAVVTYGLVLNLHLV